MLWNKKNGFRVFVAGSKALSKERMICRSVCSKLQNRWERTISTMTYEDFPSELSDTGHQKEYNRYISEQVDLIVFVFSGRVGSITREEFIVAYESFKNNGRPKILVYFDDSSSAVRTSDVNEFKSYLDGQGQYYNEYSSDKGLEIQVERHIHNILLEQDKIKKSFFCSLIGRILCVWLTLSLIGGVGMYVYDCFMSDKTCLELANYYVRDTDDGHYCYVFPDVTYYYNPDAEDESAVRIISHVGNTLGTDITVSNLKDVTLGATLTMLTTRSLGNSVKVKGNGKTILGYVAVAVAGALGFGVGCVIERMIFPPQFSDCMKEFLKDPKNWKLIDRCHEPKPLF